MSRPSRTCLPILLAVATVATGLLSAAAATVAWPPSAGLVIGEVVTGASGASDEYVELYNRADAPVQLADLELVYASASGKTVTRKQTWSGGSVGPGRRLLIANADGAFAAQADHVYPGGLSAAGGSIVLRRVGGDVIDALSWGSAESGFVEGAPGSAPAAGSSLERRPGGAGGNGRDTNDNAADTIVNPDPVAAGSGHVDPPVPNPEPPAPTAEPTAAPTPAPTLPPTPQPMPTAEPTADPTPQPSPAAPTDRPPDPTAVPTPGDATPGPTDPPPSEPADPTPTPTVVPDPTVAPQPTADPDETPLPAPSEAPPSGSPTPLRIAAIRELSIGTDVRTEGTVTTRPGRLLGDRVAVIQDDTGGIPVRLAAGSDLDLPRGTILRVRGVLAAPYGNLEIRPPDTGAVDVVGSAGLPEARPITSAEVGEPAEGQLAVIVGTITKVERRSSGALSVTVQDEAGSTRVFVHAPIGLERGDMKMHKTFRITGVVGQRASSSGADDGHRLWPRARTDVVLVPAGRPGESPAPGKDPGGPGPDRPAKQSIADLVTGTEATVVGSVTAPAGLLDADGRRVTIEDRTGAILVRYPEGATPAAVGSQVRVSGGVDTWFGTPQLEAVEAPTRRGRRPVRAARLRRPPDERDEWQLVAVSVRIVETERDGESWRAEAAFGSGSTLPIVGLASSGIPADVVEPGRAGRVVGIVRRAHPSATDQRFAIVPRSVRDIRLGRAVAQDGGRPDDGDGAGEGGSTSGSATIAVTAELGSLAGLMRTRVRVGGRLADVRGRVLTLHDGSGAGHVRLAPEAGTVEPTLEVGEVVNVAGTVEPRRAGGPEVVVRSAGDIWRAARLDDAGPTALLSASIHEPVPPAAAGPEPQDRGVPPLLLVAAALLAIGAALAFGAAAWLWLRPGEARPSTKRA